MTVGSEKLVSVSTASIAAAGGEIALPVTEAFGPGAYVTATLYRPEKRRKAACRCGRSA